MLLQNKVKPHERLTRSTMADIDETVASKTGPYTGVGYFMEVIWG